MKKASVDEKKIISMIHEELRKEIPRMESDDWQYPSVESILSGKNRKTSASPVHILYPSSPFRKNTEPVELLSHILNQDTKH